MTDQDETHEEGFLLELARGRLRAATVSQDPEQIIACGEEVARITAEMERAEARVREAAAAEADELEQRRAAIADLLPIERFRMTQHTAAALQDEATEIDAAFAKIYAALRRAAPLRVELELLVGDEDLAAQLEAAWAELPALAAYWLAPADVTTGAQPRRGSFASRLPGPDEFDEEGARLRRRRARPVEKDTDDVPDLNRAIEEGRNRGTSR